MKRIAFASLFASLIATSALAQTSTVPVVDGTSFAPPPSSVSSVSGGLSENIANPAQLEVRLSSMEDEMRNLRGKNEELEFQVRKLSESLERLQRDLEMRLTDLEQGRKPGEVAPEMPAPEANNIAETPPPSETTAGEGTMQLPSDTAETPKDMYNQAFRLLNQTKYEEAAKVFEAFTKKYPKDPLIGNAYYWAGETYYIRRDFVGAADHFRAGFEALPAGPKAPDNLLKLAMSLDALKRDKEACVVLQQVVSKFKKDATSVVDKAQQEQKRIGCK